MSEDEVIAQAFIDVRDGILSLDWQKICDAYEAISGEKIAIPKKPKTKLEKIREMMKDKAPEEPTEDDTDDEVEEKPAKKRGKKKEPANENAIEVVVKKEKGGTRFARDGFQVISTAPDPSEIAKNKKLAAKKDKSNRRVMVPLEEKFDPEDPDKDVRYNAKQPGIPAPWR